MKLFIVVYRCNKTSEAVLTGCKSEQKVDPVLTGYSEDKVNHEKLLKVATSKFVGGDNNK